MEIGQLGEVRQPFEIKQPFSPTRFRTLEGVEGIERLFSKLPKIRLEPNILTDKGQQLLKQYRIDNNVDAKDTKRLLTKEEIAIIKEYVKIHAIDTEWNPKTGETYLICVDDDIEERKSNFNMSRIPKRPKFLFTDKTIEMLEFVVSHCQESLCFTYNIQAEFDAIFRQWVIEKAPHVKSYQKRRNFVENMKKVYTTVVNGFTRRRTGFYCGRFFISWIKGKYFSISTGKHVVRIYDLTNFFDKLPLSENSKRYLTGREKLEFEHGDASKYTNEEKVKYCNNDCLLTKELGRVLFDNILNCFGFVPRNWNSISSIAKELMIRKISSDFLKPFSKVCETPEGREFVRALQEYNMRGYKGGLFFNTQKALVSNVVWLDIVSAYTSILRDITDMNDGYFEFTKFFFPSLEFGLYHIVHKFDGLFPFRQKDSTIVYPEFRKTMQEDYLTSHEISFMVKNYNWSEGNDFFVLDGFVFIRGKPNEDNTRWIENPIQYPFRDLIR